MGMVVVLALGSALCTLTFTQLIAWDATWVAWCQANFSGRQLDVLEQAPGWIFVAQLLAMLSIAMPRAVSIGSRR